MAVGPEFDERVRRGFVETFFSQDLKGVRRYIRRIRDQAMNHFQPIMSASCSCQRL